MKRHANKLQSLLFINATRIRSDASLPPVLAVTRGPAHSQVHPSISQNACFPHRPHDPAYFSCSAGFGRQHPMQTGCQYRGIQQSFASQGPVRGRIVVGGIGCAGGEVRAYQCSSKICSCAIGRGKWYTAAYRACGSRHYVTCAIGEEKRPTSCFITCHTSEHNHQPVQATKTRLYTPVHRRIVFLVASSLHQNTGPRAGHVEQW
jgi:hypothetical protein